MPIPSGCLSAESMFLLCNGVFCYKPYLSRSSYLIAYPIKCVQSHGNICTVASL